MILKKDVKLVNKPVTLMRRIQTTILIILMLFLFSFLAGVLHQQKESVSYQELVPSKYEVRVSNSIGSHTYYCDSYSLDNNTYKLFDKNGELLNQITITAGYAVEIKAK